MAFNARGAAIASLQLPAPTLGTHNYQAVYNGDSNYTESTSAVLIETALPARAATSLAVSSNLNPSSLLQPVIFNATLSFPSSAATPPSGTITLTSGTTVVGTATLLFDPVFPSKIVVAIPSSKLPGGSSTLIADYLGDPNFTGSTSPGFTQTVSKLTSAIDFYAVPSSSGAAANVYPADPSLDISPFLRPTGNLQVFEGQNLVLTVPLVQIFGAPSYAYMTFSGLLTRGPHILNAVYLGDANYQASQSPPTTVQVMK